MKQNPPSAARAEASQSYSPSALVWFWLPWSTHSQPHVQVIVLTTQCVFVRCKSWNISLELLGGREIRQLLLQEYVSGSWLPKNHFCAKTCFYQHCRNDKINLKNAGFETHSHPVTPRMDRRWQHHRLNEAAWRYSRYHAKRRLFSIIGSTKPSRCSRGWH